MSLNLRASRRSRGTALQAELLEDRNLLSIGAPLPASSAVSFSAEFYTVSAGAGTASILLQNNEAPGADGSPTASPEQVYLSFGSGTAVPGVDYTPGGQAVSFSAGESSKTVQLPILPGSPSEGTRVVEVELAAAPGSQPFAAAYLDITHNSDTTPPTVIATKAITKGAKITAFVITFSKDMAPGPIQDVNNYAIGNPRTLRYVKSAQWVTTTQVLPLRSAVYDPTSHSVTLALRKGLRTFPYFTIMDRQSFDLLNQAVQMTQQNTQASPSPIIPQISAITDTTGNPLDSTHSGTPDGALLALVGVGKAGRKFLASVNQVASSMKP
jgi:Calx-beta domain